MTAPPGRPFAILSALTALYHATSCLSLTFFGFLTITLDDRPVTRLESDKVRRLLAQLDLEPERAFRRKR